MWWDGIEDGLEATGFSWRGDSESRVGRYLGCSAGSRQRNAESDLRATGATNRYLASRNRIKKTRGPLPGAGRTGFPGPGLGSLVRRGGRVCRTVGEAKEA